MAAGSSRKQRTRFKVGDTVRIDQRASLGHCRTPIYLRGKTGVIVGLQGLFHDPTRLAYHRPGLPMLNWYKVRFRQTDLWDRYRGSAGDHLDADVQEDWLVAAREKSP